MVARDVLEVDPAAGELEPVRDLLLVRGDGERAEVRREDEAHRVRSTPSSTISPTTSSIHGDQCRIPR